MVPARTWRVHEVEMALTERLKLRKQMAAAAGKKSTTSLSLFKEMRDGLAPMVCVPVRCFSVGGDSEQDVKRLPWIFVPPCRYGWSCWRPGFAFAHNQARERQEGRGGVLGCGSLASWDRIVQCLHRIRNRSVFWCSGVLLARERETRPTPPLQQS